MKQVLFIYNPNAGKEMLKPKLADILDIIVKAGYEVTVYPTQEYRDAYKKVAGMEAKYDRVICAGGDGTLDEVVSGMMEREERIPIGYIPAGTTNDFANSLHIPKDILQAARTAVSGAEFACDVGHFNRDVFVYIAAFGLFTDVSYETKQEMKNVLGHLAYLLEGITRIFDIPSYRIKVSHDSEEFEDEFIFGMVTNSRSVGGFRNMIGKNVVFDDGEFEVTLIKTPKNILALQEIVAALLIEQIDSKYMYSFKTGKIRVESLEEIPWTLDGEYGGQHDDVRIWDNRKALKIIVPEKYVDNLSQDGIERVKKQKEAEEAEWLKLSTNV